MLGFFFSHTIWETEGTVMRHLFQVGLCVVWCISPAQAKCVKPESLVRTTVRIVGDIVREEEGVPVTYEIHGTAWFLTPTHLVTVTHVARALNTTNAWRTVTLTQELPHNGMPEYTEVTQVRLAGAVYGRTQEGLTVLELQAPFAGAQVARVRETELVHDESISGVGYPHYTLTFVTGAYLEYLTYTDDGTTIFREYRMTLADRSGNRDAFGPGASGSPIFDCNGSVVFTVSHSLPSLSFRICSRETGVCTETAPIPKPPGTPTNLAVPSKGLTDMRRMLTEDAMP